MFPCRAAFKLCGPRRGWSRLYTQSRSPVSPTQCDLVTQWTLAWRIAQRVLGSLSAATVLCGLPCGPKLGLAACLGPFRMPLAHSFGIVLPAAVDGLIATIPSLLAAERKGTEMTDWTAAGGRASQQEGWLPCGFPFVPFWRQPPSNEKGISPSLPRLFPSRLDQWIAQDQPLRPNPSLSGQLGQAVLRQLLEEESHWDLTKQELREKTAVSEASALERWCFME